MIRLLGIAGLLVILAAGVAHGAGAPARTNATPGLGDYDVPFYPDGTYTEGVQSPGDFLGYRLGARPTPPSDIIRYFKYLSDRFDNAALHTYGQTWEGRPLVYLVIASPENFQHLDRIRADLAKLDDPRNTDDKEAQRIIERSPAIAWLGYGIHGDELSSNEAAMQLAYQLLAGTDEQTRRLRDRLIVVIDPAQNPDGRARFVEQLRTWNGVITSTDVHSLAHSGMWPYGRTNHYLFDMNRDWFSQVQPETRARTAAMLQWMPQYALDCHEMGPYDSYLFSPPRAPFNPDQPDYIRKWWERLASDHAAAFDSYGWSYYTREWNEEFFPGYGSSWPTYLGAVGMLFEEAGVDGSAVKRPEGTVMTYRETIHHQFIASLSNLLTVAAGRKELLNDYYHLKVANLHSKASAFLFPPSPDAARLERLADTLRRQHIEVERSAAAFRAAGITSWNGTRSDGRKFPAGTLVVRTNQPLRQLVEVILSFEVRMSTSFLETERKEELEHDDTRIYDATGWSLPLAYGLESYFAEALPHARLQPYKPAAARGGVTHPESTIGFAFDCRDDRAYQLLVRLFDAGYNVWCSRKPFLVDGRKFARGSFLIRVNGQTGADGFDADRLGQLAQETGVEVVGVTHGYGHEPYADVGGQEFRLLKAPRVALVGGSPLATTDFGAMWHLLDARLQLRASLLDVNTINRTDLSEYNVVVLPSDYAGADDFRRRLGEAGVKRLRDWVSDGGTLIAEGAATAFLADTSVAMTSVRQRRQVLDHLAEYEQARADARAARSPHVDSLAVWGNAGDHDGGGDEQETPSKEEVAREDARARKLFPRGAILRVDLDPENWLASGCGEWVPVMFASRNAYLAKAPVDVAGRLAGAEQIRLSGLMWPEARARWAHSVYAARERVGKGQVIVFATLPDFRGYFYGAERLLVNAILLGPGMGTAREARW